MKQGRKTGQGHAVSQPTNEAALRGHHRSVLTHGGCVLMHAPPLPTHFGSQRRYAADVHPSPYGAGLRRQSRGRHRQDVDRGYAAGLSRGTAANHPTAATPRNGYAGSGADAEYRCGAAASRNLDAEYRCAIAVGPRSYCCRGFA